MALQLVLLAFCFISCVEYPHIPQENLLYDHFRSNTSSDSSAVSAQNDEISLEFNLRQWILDAEIRLVDFFNWHLFGPGTIRENFPFKLVIPVSFLLFSIAVHYFGTWLGDIKKYEIDKLADKVKLFWSAYNNGHGDINNDATLQFLRDLNGLKLNNVGTDIGAYVAEDPFKVDWKQVASRMFLPSIITVAGILVQQLYMSIGMIYQGNSSALDKFKVLYDQVISSESIFSFYVANCLATSFFSLKTDGSYSVSYHITWGLAFIALRRFLRNLGSHPDYPSWVLFSLYAIVTTIYAFGGPHRTYVLIMRQVPAANAKEFSEKVKTMRDTLSDFWENSVPGIFKTSPIYVTVFLVGVFILFITMTSIAEVTELCNALFSLREIPENVGGVVVSRKVWDIGLFGSLLKRNFTVRCIRYPFAYTRYYLRYDFYYTIGLMNHLHGLPASWFKTGLPALDTFKEIIPLPLFYAARNDAFSWEKEGPPSFEWE